MSSAADGTTGRAHARAAATVALRSDALAIHGGTPVRATLLPYGRHSVEEADIAAVADVLRSSFLTTGPAVTDFEAALAERAGARHAVAFSSGTAALHAACDAAGLGRGDEAITTPLTFCATANAVLYTGATPVFADVDPGTLALDPDAVRERITPRTRALLPVDYAGQPADLGALRALAVEHDLVVIEDAAHALGAAQDGRPVGALATLTTFSFHPVKHVAAGEGGAVTTDDSALAHRLRVFRNHGIDSDPHERARRGEWTYAMESLGFNYRISDIACALAGSQLSRLDANLARRRAIAAQYDAALAAITGARALARRAGAEHAWHLYPILLDADALAVDRGTIFRALRAEGIGVNVHYPPVHLHPYYRRELGTRPGSCPVAEAAYEQLVSLPLFHGMTDADANDVVRALAKVLAWARR